MSFPPHILKLSRDFRKNATPAEKYLWQFLRGRKLQGLKFLRQHPICYHFDSFTPHFFIADFFCAEKRLVIELDGSSHIGKEDHDNLRDEILQIRNIRTMRIKNEELTDISAVLQKIICA